VLVDVIAVLEVSVAIVQVVDVVLVLDCLATVSFGVRIVMVGMHLRLRMPLTIMDMIHMVTVEHYLAAVVRQVLVIEVLGVHAHENSSVGFLILTFLPHSCDGKARPATT
jgi:hypothetical protein